MPLEDEIAMRLAATWKHAEPRLRKLADRLCRSTADAADLVQDTYERAAKMGMPEDVRTPCAWLTTIMHNLFIDRCRAEARKPVQESLEVHEAILMNDEPVEEPPWGMLTADDVRAAVDELDQIYRDVYVMHTFKGRSYEAIAARLKIDRVTVGTRLNRARTKLREVLSRRRENKP